MSAPIAVDPSAVAQRPAPLRMRDDEWLAWEHDGLSDGDQRRGHRSYADPGCRCSQSAAGAVCVWRLGVTRSAPFAVCAVGRSRTGIRICFSWQRNVVID